MSKAWKVTVEGIDCITFSRTRSRAKWIAVRSYWDAGYGDGWPKKKWPQVKAIRCPIYDCDIAAGMEYQAWDEKYLKHGGAKGM